jgi:hypothetical protein
MEARMVTVKSLREEWARHVPQYDRMIEFLEKRVKFLRSSCVKNEDLACDIERRAQHMKAWRAELLEILAA